MESAAARNLINETFEDVALVLGGIFAVHGVEDEAVWQVMKHLDLAHENALVKLAGMEPLPPRPTAPARDSVPHPAVEALLAKLRKRSTLHSKENGR